MASLQLSCKLLATKRHSHTSPFPKPPRLLGAPGRRCGVTCSGGGSSIDRRNMLLGLGGLYGASRAMAEPIKAPDLSKCETEGAFDARTKDNLDVNCCPPYMIPDDPVPIPDYVFPEFTKTRLRPAAHMMDPSYIAKYEKAIAKMKELDESDPNNPCGFTQQANVHCAYCNGPHNQVGHEGLDLQIHGSWLFFPWHRWYLYFYERILGSLIDDDAFALPFWNWDNPPGMDIPECFDAKCSPLYDPLRNPGHRRPSVVDLSGVSNETNCTELISENLTTMYSDMIRSPQSSFDFFGMPISDGETPKGSGTIERGCHTGIHRWVGDPRQKYHENMGNFYSSGRDPMFYSHHANVDRMWTIWETLPASYDKVIADSDFLDASFLFYDENRRLVKVKVGNALDHRAMGYGYQHVPTPWLEYTPPLVLARANTKEISEGVETTDRVLPLTLSTTARVLVSKTTKGKADEVLVLDDIVTDPSLFVKFDVYINDQDREPQKLNKAEFAGTYSQLPHKTSSGKSTNSINLSLKELYDNIDIADDDDTVVVTIIPRSNGKDITIGGIKIVAAAH